MVEIVRAAQKRTLVPEESVTVHEYDTQDSVINGATAEIKGRYPEQGFVLNEKVKELVFVVSGRGALVMPDGTKDVCAGDVILLDAMEKFAWQGDMILFMATTPAFDPSQYAHVE